MGITWIIQPRVDHPENHSYPETFRGQVLINSNLPRAVAKKAYTDMNSPQMNQLANDIEVYATTNNISEEEQSKLLDAADWLTYWASNRKRISSW